VSTSSLLVPVKPSTEIARNRLHPISVSGEVIDGLQSPYPQLVTAQTEIHDQADSLQGPAVPKEIGRSVYF
jgi:hypothetical protein